MNTKTTHYPACNFINGEKVISTAIRSKDVICPLNGELISSVQLSTAQELNAAVEKAKAAFQKWRSLTIKARSQVFFRYKALIEKDIDLLSELIRVEHGKPIADAQAEIAKAIEVVEFACSLPQISAGEIMEVSQGVDCKETRVPLGVVASITPFNFPSMVPHWTIPIAITLGNTFILKPSEQTPISAVKIGEYLKDAGLPDGVFNVVQGDKEVVEAICDHPDIKAVSFVGSSAIGELVYKRCANHLKRALCMGSAKNHIILMPDAHVKMSASNIVASFIGCTGQRCMAASVLVAVGDCEQTIQAIIAESKKMALEKTIGPVISKEALNRINQYIEWAHENNATILLDGRKAEGISELPGFYIGPTIIEVSSPENKLIQEEIFGPVLTIIRVNTAAEAVAIQNKSQYGNGASVFTQSGATAHYISDRLTSGMIGVNIGVPVPREPFGFGGWKASRFGVGDITGKSSIRFWTQDKKVTVKWNTDETAVNWMS